MILDGRKMKFASRKQLNQQKKAKKQSNPVMLVHLSKKQMVGVNAVLSNSYCFNAFQKSGAPGETRTRDPLLRRYAVQNSKCRFWCRLRGSASFISPLNWTEVGPKRMGVTRRNACLTIYGIEQLLQYFVTKPPF